MYKVSIIVPVYNIEKYLAKCLDSLINQTLKEIEIICVNDGSTDNSAEILNEYAQKDSRIRIINQENAGLSAARNTGINNANGEYIGYVDSDDWVDLNFYENLYNAAKENNADIAVAGIKRVGGEDYKEKVFLKFEKTTTTENTDEKFRLCDIPDKSYVWNKIYKLSEIKEHSLYFRVGVNYEDIIYAPKIIHTLNCLTTVPDTYYYYLKRRGSIVAQKSQKKYFYAAMEEAKKYFEDNNINIADHLTDQKKYKILGLTVFKIKTRGEVKEAILLNFIKWKI